MADVALPAAADTLSRAADLIEKWMSGANTTPPGVRWHAHRGAVVWERDTGWSDGEDLVTVATGCTTDNAEFIATLDPYAGGPLVPALRWAAAVASGGNDPSERRAVRYLTEFARRLLREEET